MPNRLFARSHQARAAALELTAGRDGFSRCIGSDVYAREDGTGIAVRLSEVGWELQPLTQEGLLDRQQSALMAREGRWLLDAQEYRLRASETAVRATRERCLRRAEECEGWARAVRVELNALIEARCARRAMLESSVRHAHSKALLASAWFSGVSRRAA